MVKKYFVHNGQESQGPFDFFELKQRDIQKNTPIWYEGLSDWIPAENISELKVLFDGPKPPPLISNFVPPVNRDNLKQNPVPVERPKSKTWLNILLILGVIIAALLAFNLFYRTVKTVETVKTIEKQNVEKQKVEDDKSLIKNSITSYVSARIGYYQYREIGGIFNLSILVHNTSPYLIDNVKIKVDYVKANGSLWKSEYLNSGKVAPGSRISVKAPDSNRGTSVQCSVLEISSAALGL